MENDCPGNVETGASLLSYGDGISDLLELLSGDVLEDGSDQIFTGEIETSSKFELDECGPLYTSELDESLCAKRIKLDSGAAGVIIPTSSDVVEELEDTLEESTAGSIYCVSCNLKFFARIVVKVILNSWPTCLLSYPTDDKNLLYAVMACKQCIYHTCIERRGYEWIYFIAYV